MIKQCVSCQRKITLGFIYVANNKKNYFCSMPCVKKELRKKKKIKRALSKNILYFKNWRGTVFVVFDNQYNSLEAAEFILEKYGQPNTKIIEKQYDPLAPLYEIINDVQVEM